MKIRLNSLKKYIYDLEYAISVKDTKSVLKVSRTIKNIVSDIENDFSIVTSFADGVKYKKIYIIDALYKPFHLKKYDGKSLEKFLTIRTYDLKVANALDAHNRFWKQNKVFKTNIFGLVPIDMISPDSMNTLMQNGWVVVNVDVLDFTKSIAKLRDIISYSERNFKYFTVLEEKEKDNLFVLKF